MPATMSLTRKKEKKLDEQVRIVSALDLKAKQILLKRGQPTDKSFLLLDIDPTEDVPKSYTLGFDPSFVLSHEEETDLIGFLLDIYLRTGVLVHY